MSSIDKPIENPFDTVEEWQSFTAEERMLDKGDYVARIVEAKNDTSTNGNPQINLRFKDVNGQGSIRAWEVYHEELLGKVVALYNRSGTQRPQPGEFDRDDKMRISQRALDRLVGRLIGILVREEPSWKDPTRMRSEVKGYVEPARITGEPDTSDLPAGGDADFDFSSQPQFADDDIPF